MAADGRRVLGAVLTGGASRRMGADKAFVELGGTPFIVRAAEVLRAGGCDPVVAVGGAVEPLAAVGLHVVPDRRPGEGPLDGIVRALEVADGSPAVVVACDLPLLSSSTVAALLAALDDSAGSLDVVVAVSARREPLCAAWAPGARATLVQAFDAGERAVHRALELLRVGEVAVALDEVRNINTPADLAEVEGPGGSMTDGGASGDRPSS